MRDKTEKMNINAEEAKKLLFLYKAVRRNGFELEIDGAFILEKEGRLVRLYSLDDALAAIEFYEAFTDRDSVTHSGKADYSILWPSFEQEDK